MKTANFTAMLMAGCLLAGAAHSQSLEASRYKNAQGIEVFSGRMGAATVPAAALKESTVTAPSSFESRLAAESRPAAAQAVPVAAKHLKVEAAEQAERDRDRLSILKTELSNEERALGLKIQALASPRATKDLNAEQQQSLREEVLRHEENVRALQREIRRMGLAPGALPMKVSFSKADTSSR